VCEGGCVRVGWVGGGGIWVVGGILCCSTTTIYRMA
jgi:hypothetical protein